LRYLLSTILFLFLLAVPAQASPPIAVPGQTALLAASAEECAFEEAPWVVLSGVKECGLVLNWNAGPELRANQRKQIAALLCAGKIRPLGVREALHRALPVLTVQILKDQCFVELTQVGVKDLRTQRLPIWYARIRGDLREPSSAREAVQQGLEQFVDDCRRANP
jgi:hypothetical protein